MPLKSRSKASEWKKKQTLSSPVKGRQLEATVHTSLPPLVKGALRGHLIVSLEGGIVWEYKVGPPTPKLCVQLKWWGEKTPGTTFRLPVHVGSVSDSQLPDATSVAYFPIRSSLSQLSAYLKDMGSLTFQVGLGHMTDNSMVIGQAVVPSLKQLTPNSPLAGRYPVVNSSGVHLGKLCVQIKIKTSPPAKEVPAQRKVALNPPEFVVGPGASLRERQFENSPPNLPKEYMNTLVGEQNKAEVSRTRRGILREIHVPTGREEVEERGMEGVELGARQMEVISELIERGQQLRSEMVKSIVNQEANIEGYPPEKKQQEERVDAATLSLLSANLKQADYCGGGIDVNLCSTGIDINTSSEEEYGMDNILSDISLDESDYPLHDAALLSALYSLDTTQPTSGSGGGHKPERQRMVSFDKEEEEDGVKTEEVVGDKINSSVSDKDESQKLSSKLSRERRVKDAALSVGGLEEGGADKVTTAVEPVSPSHTHQTKAKTDSLTTLSSYFVKGQSSLETAIVSAVGLEKLTHLGRVSSVRLTVDSLKIEPSFAKQILTQNRGKKSTFKAGSNVGIPPAYATKSPTYFVEYQFPAMLHQARVRSLTRRWPTSHELMRIASKKMKNGVVKFNHHSVFPVQFNSSVVHHWWNSALIFRVYCRPPTERMPFLVGKAVLPLKRLLTSKSPSGGHYALEIKTSTLADAVRERETDDDKVIGSVQVSLELVASGKRDFPLRDLDSRAEEEDGNVAADTDDAVHCQDGTTETRQPLGGGESVEGVVSHQQSSPIHFREDTNHREVVEKPTALQLLLLIPEAVDVSALSPPSSPSLLEGHHDKLSVPNCYLICKLFCAKPHPHTPVQWASKNPQFGIKQLFPLFLTPALLNQVTNNFTVVEVWHRTPGTSTDDELLGLVKLSLHQFYLAFSDEASVHLCCQAELPVVAVDSYCPIVNPFSGHTFGHLAVLLALGTPSQITRLQQLYASGGYTLQLPHRPPAQARKARQSTSIKPAAAPSACVGERQAGGQVEHVFELCVEGVREATAFANTVWGEADCFVQYHFPTLTSDDEDNEQAVLEVSLHPYRTGTTLCVPSPPFSHTTRHTLLLDSGEPVQKYVMAACGGGLGGGVPFELWRRYYYPNIRDQLVARASLPVAKLCALVTMQRNRGAGSSNVQDFALPLKLVTDKVVTDGGGVLDVSMRYEAVHFSDVKNIEDSQHVNITVGILRAAGLKDAAALVAPDNPVAMGLAAEVGVNTYATITLPGILKEKRTTKTIARSFSPEFSHLFDLALPLTYLSLKASSSSPTTLAQKLAEGYILVELLHQPPRRGTASLTGAWQGTGMSGSGVVTGRRVAHTTKDVLLGRARVPLLQLLRKATGIHGWFALDSPVPTSPSVGERDGGGRGITGGVEISASFANEEIRELVLTSGLRQGWRAPDDLLSGPPATSLPAGGVRSRSTRHAHKENKSPFSFDGKCVKFEIAISHATLQLSAVDIQTAPQPTHKYCFVRYRFFDKKAVMTSPKTISCSRDGSATYQLNHKAQLHLTGSAQLQWYLSEESMEVQLWTSLSKRQLREGPTPLAEDTLIGSAYVPLSDVIGGESVGGEFPLFKAGVDRLGGQSLNIEILKMVLPDDESTPQTAEGDGVSCMEVLDSSEEEGGLLAETIQEEGSKRDLEGETKKPTAEREGEEDEMVQDTFGARVMIHEALHLPASRTESGTSGDEVPPCPYVTTHPHPNVERITTASVAGSRAPVWEHQSTTRIPNHYLQPQSHGLEFQVWSKNNSTEKQDAYIGSVLVDLCPLTCGLSHICGWYNITDFSGQTQGQVKISVAPTQRISYPSPLLAYSTLVTAANSFLSRDVPLSLPSMSLVRGDPPPVLSTEQLLTDPAAEVRVHQLSSQTRSMLFQQLREEIQQLDGIQKCLLTKLSQGETPSHSSAVTTSPHHHQLTQRPLDTTSHTGFRDRPVEEAPPTAPPTLLHDKTSVISGAVSPGNTYSLQSPSSLSPHESPTHSEPSSTTVREKSLPSGEPLSMESLRERHGDSPSPLTATSRSGSLTDVSSTSSEDSSAVVESSVERQTTLQERQIKTDSPCHLEEEGSGCQLSSEDSSTGASPTPRLEDDTEITPLDKPLNTTDSSPMKSSSHLTTCTVTTTAASHTVPLPSIKTTPTMNSDPSRLKQKPCESTLEKGKSPLVTRQPSEHSTSPPTSRTPPPTIKLPNFFMTPQQLEESMRSLRAGALSRPPPKAHLECAPPPPPSRPQPSLHCHHEAMESRLKTLQEVRAYLESRRRTKEGQLPREISAAETQRLARIFSA